MSGRRRDIKKQAGGACGTAPASGGCGPAGTGAGATLAELVEDYRRNCRPSAEEERDFFMNSPSLMVALEDAGGGIRPGPGRKRHNHQRRIPPAVLSRATAILKENADRLSACRTFDELHSLCDDLLRHGWGAGVLYVYDVAHRIGMFLKLPPQAVYLHAGTRDGARALGLDVSAGKLMLRDLPKPLHALSAEEVEDFLCIYKSRLTRSMG